MSMSDASAAKSTASRPTRSFTPFAASGSASGLLAKTFRSSTLKLALICIVAFGAAVLALFGYVYWSTASFVRSRSDQAVAAEVASLQEIYGRAGRDALVAAITERVGDRHFDVWLYLLADNAFAPIAGNLRIWPSALSEIGDRGDPGVQDLPSDAAPLRVKLATLADGSHLLVARNIEDLDAFVASIRMALAASIAFTFVLGGFASVFVTRRTVGRIEAINATSRAIMQTGLGQRIPLRGTRDEWDQLAENLNLMLDRIEGLMGEVKLVTDNVAHDLRTPLARMRGRLEKAYARPRDDEQDQSLIGDTLADLDAVLRMFASLTRISQIEASDRMAGFRPVDLAEIAREVVELFDAAAEEKGGHLHVVADAPVLVTGDRDLLF